MKQQLNTTYHRAVATYRTFVYCVLAVSLFINYMTMYGKWNTVGLLLPAEPVVAQDTQKVTLSSDKQEWINEVLERKEKRLAAKKK